MAKIFISRKFTGEAFDRLVNSDNDVNVFTEDRPMTPEELLENAKGSDAVLSFLTDKINAEVIDAIGPQLKVLSNYAVGFNNINVDDATAKGVVVTNTPSEEVNQSVAEFAITLMTALAKRIVEADQSTRKGAYHGWEPHIYIGTNMLGKTLGIVGMGRIGEITAKIGKGYDMKVLYHNRSRKEDLEGELGVEYRENLDELLSQSDFVSLHVPLTDETRHLINKDTLAKMKRGSFLINTARGPVVDEHALVEALRDGQVAGAGIDVYEQEPDINPELMAMENVILTPHIASATKEARDKMGEQAVSALLEVLSGSMPENIVNSEVWERRRT